MKVSLSEPMRNWVARRIESGAYASVGDYVRDLIRRDQAHLDEREALIAALIAGEDSGVSKRSVPGIFESIKRELAGKTVD